MEVDTHQVILSPKGLELGLSGSCLVGLMLYQVQMNGEHLLRADSTQLCHYEH